LSAAASRVWLAFDGLRNVASVAAMCGGLAKTRRYIVDLLLEGLLACQTSDMCSC
jgi:hypothetical protein